MLRTSAVPNVSLSSKPIFYAAVIDYYSSAETKQYYENHFFILQIFIEQQEYKLERSYSSFCELDLKLRRQFPRSVLPKLPLNGITVYQKKHHKRFPILSSFADSNKKKEMNYDSTHQHHILSTVTMTAELNRKTAIDRKGERLLSFAEEGWQIHHSIDRLGMGVVGGLTKVQDLTENLSSKKLPLTLYLQQLLSLQEILQSEVIMQFLDEEIPDYFLYAYPKPVVTTVNASGSPLSSSATTSRAISTAPNPLTSTTTTPATNVTADKDIIIPLSTYFLPTAEVIDNLEVYLLLKNEPLLQKRLKKESFEVSVPIKADQKVYYLFFTDLYDIALSITLEETTTSQNVSISPSASSPFLTGSESDTPSKPRKMLSAFAGGKRENPTERGNNLSSGKRQITISNHHRYPSHEKVQWGSIDLTTLPDCLEGVLTFRFDNTYSKWRSKQLNFIIKCFDEEIIQENLQKTREVQQMKQDFQQKRLFLKQVFHTLSNYLVLANNNIIPAYLKNSRRNTEGEIDSSEEVEEGVEPKSSSSSSAKLPQDSPAMNSARKHDPGKLISASMSTASEDRNDEEPDSNDKNDNEEEVTMDDLFSLQRIPPEQDTIRSSLNYSNLLPVSTSPSSTVPSEREKRIQQLTQKELLNQLRQLTQEKKNLITILQEKDQAYCTLQQEKETVEQKQQQTEEKLLSLTAELFSVKHELQTLSQQYQQQVTNQRQYQQNHRYSVEELLSFASFNELKKNDEKSRKEAPLESEEGFAASAIENFKTLFEYSKNLQKSHEELQGEFQQYQEQVLPKLKTERKQLKMIGNQLKEQLENKTRELEYTVHEKDLLLQENEELRKEIELFKQSQQEKQFNLSSLPLVLPPIGSPSITPSVSSSFEENKDQDSRINPLPSPPIPLKITVTPEDLKGIVLQVHEPEEETTSRANLPTTYEEEENSSSNKQIIIQDGKVFQHLGYQEFDVAEEGEEEEGDNQRQEGVVPNYHFMDGYGSEKKLVKVNFENEPDDFQMAMEVMQETFKDLMPSWFSSK